MFWTKVAQFGPTGTPQKSAFFQERGRKRMKELGEVTFMKEGMKALDDTRILALTHLKFVVSFPRYGHLKKKCWYKKFCNSKSWLLLTGHFGPVFIRPSQWSITAVVYMWPPGGHFISPSIPCLISQFAEHILVADLVKKHHNLTPLLLLGGNP